MIPKECKRLAEVDFPIAVVSRHSAREKSIRHGHPSTLHLWWARRPLAACRAMLMALLLPDPCDPHCPEDFKVEARRVLLTLPARPERWSTEIRSDEGLREILLEFIGDFANWDLAANRGYQSCARGLVASAHGPDSPLAVDPFSGGGAIPLEAARLGCDVFASDLNPVACQILRVVLDDVPRLGDALPTLVRDAGEAIRAEAIDALSCYYPPDQDGAKPIAYLWARTVRCEAPRCGAEIPLVRSRWLCKKANRRRALRFEPDACDKGAPEVRIEIFTPRTEGEVGSGTVSRARATCPCCGVAIPPDRVRSQLTEQRGGADALFDESGNRIGGARLLAVVLLRPGDTGRQYREPNESDYRVVWDATRRLQAVLKQWESESGGAPCPIPTESLPATGGLGFRVQRYGIKQWSDMFSARQLLALYTFAGILARRTEAPRSLMLALGKLADLANSLSPWEPVAECPRQVMNQGRVKPPWDFAEGVPLSDSSAGFAVCVENHVKGLLSVQGVDYPAQVSQEKAQQSPLPDESAAVWFTDPPYYDAIPYSDLSDFFLTWFRRARPFDDSLCNTAHR